MGLIPFHDSTMVSEIRSSGEMSSKTITKKMLVLLAGGVKLPAAFLLANGEKIAKEAPYDWQKFNKKRLKETIIRLKNNGLIDIDDVGGEKLFVLTEKGNKKIQRYIIDEMEIEIPKKWDEIWRMVIFDIPESKRRARQIFVQKLKKLGFYQIQRSVFVHPFECRDEIDFMKEALGIGDYVTYIAANLISEDEKIKKFYIKKAGKEKEGAMMRYFKLFT